MTGGDARTRPAPSPWRSRPSSHEALSAASGDEYLRLTWFFGTLLVINIAIGVVTGIVQQLHISEKRRSDSYVFCALSVRLRIRSIRVIGRLCLRSRPTDQRGALSRASTPAFASATFQLAGPRTDGRGAGRTDTPSHNTARRTVLVRVNKSGTFCGFFSPTQALTLPAADG